MKTATRAISVCCVPCRSALFYLGSRVSWAFHGRSRPAKARHCFEYPVKGAGHVMLVMFSDDRFRHAAIVANVARGDTRAQHPTDRGVPQRVRADIEQFGRSADALESLGDAQHRLALPLNNRTIGDAESMPP